MKARYVLVVAVAALAVGVGQVVVHQRHASRLAASIVANDQLGHDVTAQLATLQTYIHGHIATSQQVTLDGSYNRAVAAAAAAAAPASNGTIYAQAQAACASHADSLVQARCVQAYLASHATVGANPTAIPTPVKADYVKSFTAPRWTPDSAGLALVVAAASLALAAYLVALGRF